jgi:hypothetical protein
MKDVKTPDTKPGSNFAIDLSYRILPHHFQSARPKHDGDLQIIPFLLHIECISSFPRVSTAHGNTTLEQIRDFTKR